MNDSHSLELFDVSKRYGTHIALDGVSLEVPQGSIFGLLGPNGAGKTTLIRMVAGITGPDQGSISFFGKPMSSDHISSLGYLPEERGLYKNMRVGEQAMYFARLRGMEKKEAERELADWFERLEVDGWWNKEVADLSKGMARYLKLKVSVESSRGPFEKISTHPRAQPPPHTTPWARPAPEDAPFADAILFALHPRVLSNVLVEVGPHDAAQLAVGELQAAALTGHCPHLPGRARAPRREPRRIGRSRGAP